MSKLRVLTLIGLCGALLPTLAAAGNGTGSCLALELIDRVPFPSLPEGTFQEIAFCVDDVTAEDCTFLFGDDGDWQSGVACEDRKVPFQEWDGSCLVQIPEPIGQVCVLIWTDPLAPFDSLEFCEDEGGTWFDDPAACGVPVPVTPRTGLAVLALLLLAGSLAILSRTG